MKGFTITKRKDGRYCTTVTDKSTGRRVYLYGKTAGELKNKLFNYQRKEYLGIKFNEISDLWWEQAEENLSTQSKRGYLVAKKRADLEFAGIYIKEITSKDVTAYFNKLSVFAQKTVAKHRLVLNLIFEYAIANGELEDNPCKTAKMPKGLKKEKRKSATEIDEQIIKNTSDVWLFPFFALYSGMRKGEILALQWKDIDFTDNTINVYKSVAHNGNYPEIKSPKTEAGNRYVPLLAPLKERLLKIKKRKQTDYIFSDDGKSPLTAKRYDTLFAKYKELTGITCTAHQLRHLYATKAHECGVSDKDIQEILGHKQLSTTMDIYTDFRSKQFEHIAKVLNENF